jgi:hypothetical protein
MATNLTIESPKFEKIQTEAGPNTSDAINLLWLTLNDTRKSERLDFRRAVDIMSPKVLTIEAAASVNDLDLQGCSVVSFIGSTAQNLTGFRAPDTNDSRVVIVQTIGTGTITAKHSLTSETQNQLFNSTAADVTLSTNKGTMYVYLSGKWRQVAL